MNENTDPQYDTHADEIGSGMINRAVNEGNLNINYDSVENQNSSLQAASNEWMLSKMALRIQCAGCHELLDAQHFQEHLVN